MHTVTLSKPIVEALQRLQSMGGCAGVSELGMTSPVYANFAMLRYWGFIAPVYRDNGSRIRGTWMTTERGREFLRDDLPVPISLWREGGEFVAWYDGAAEKTASEIAGPLLHPAPVSPIW